MVMVKSEFMHFWPKDFYPTGLKKILNF
jgi:hypothetical protein